MFPFLNPPGEAKGRRGRKEKKSKNKSCCLAEVCFFSLPISSTTPHTRTKLAGWACLDSCKQPTTNHTSQRGREEGLEKVSTGIGIEKAQHPVGNGGRGEEKIEYGIRLRLIYGIMTLRLNTRVNKNTEDNTTRIQAGAESSPSQVLKSGFNIFPFIPGARCLPLFC